MNSLIDSAWRAAAYCIHPRVIFMSLLPLLVMAGLAFGLAYFFWDSAIDTLNSVFQSWSLFDTLFRWLGHLGMPGLKALLAPFAVIVISTPPLVVLCLLFVALFMSPAMTKLVAKRRFPHLERRHGGSFAGSVFVGLSSTLLALLVLVVSLPFWLIPPVALVVPPLIWGWLTYRVLTYDVLSDHAGKDERQVLVERHRASLMFIGVVTGYLGAAPSLVWVSGAFLIPFAPLLIPLAIWIYTLVFAFSTLWFAHFGLAALNALRVLPVEAVASPTEFVVQRHAIGPTSSP